MAEVMSLTINPSVSAMMDGFRRPSLASTKKKAIKRFSQQLSGSLSLLPYTTTEWTKAVAEVKREYLNRRYRPCATRCSELLDGIRDSRSVEPAYLIYLHFYAASALEMQARSLHHSAPSRTSLLQQAREHYLRASELIKIADTAITQPTQRRRPSCPGLVHSPTSSVSSIASSRISPVSSISSLQDVTKRRKRVTFSDVSEGPIIRPDSPTLGFDDWLTRPSPEIISAMPLPPSAAPIHPSLLPSPISKPDLEPELEPDVDNDPFLRARSIHRYCTILTSLQCQVTRHLAFISEDLAAAQTAPPPSSNELRTLELQTRIERLRAKGWQRKRFDPQRYEALRDSAMADMLE